MAKILRCKCANTYQDERYGTGQRVHNPKAKKVGSQTQRYTCTVCGDVKEVHGA